MTPSDRVREARDAVVLLLRALDPECGQWPTHEQINERLDAYAEAIRAEHAAEIAALKADGERLDWLEKMASQLPVEVDACTSVRDGKDYRVILTGIDLDDDEHPVEDLGQGRTLREAADAARASEPRGRE